MEEFRVAGSTFGEADERVLSQVVQIAGYTSNIRALVNDSFRFCKVHNIPIAKTGRNAHARCVVKPAVGPAPRAALR